MGSKKPCAGVAENYNSLRDTHLAHYFSRQDVLRHLVQMGLVTRSGEIVPETEWRRLYAKQQRQEKETEKQNHRRRLLEAEEAAKKRVKQKIRRREAQLARQPSTSEPDLIHFDIEWSYRPASGTIGGARTSSESQETSNGTSDDTSGGNNESLSPSDRLSYGTSESKRCDIGQIRISGFSRSSPETASPWRKPDKYPSKPRFISRRGVVGEPYVASLGPNPSPKYFHILKPTNSCREVWTRLCPPQPISSRPPRPPSPPHLRLEYARGGAPCHTPTDLALLQQPAGAHNVTVFHSIVREGDEIEFTSLRRENFPFSLTIYEHGVTTGRLSACCEHRYAPGSRLGGPSGHLRVVEIVGGEPCLRCQLKTVEKRHKSQQNNQSKSKAKIQNLRPYTPPEETGSEHSSHDEESSSNHSDRSSKSKSNHYSQISMKGSSQSLSDSDDSSTDIQDSPSQYHKLKKSSKGQLCQYSSDSCNGPSDLEVAAVLGVTPGLSDSPKRQLGRRKLSCSEKTSTSGSTTQSDSSTRKHSSKDRKSKHRGYGRSRQLSSSSNQESQRDPSNEGKLHLIPSSLEGQLDDAIEGGSSIYHKISESAFERRSSSSKSRSGSVRSRRRQSNGDGFNNPTKLDSFYSQQTFTSSASDTQAASGHASEVSYGSSFEEDDDNNEEDEKEVREDKSTEEEKKRTETTDAEDDEMDTDGEENEKTISSELEEEVGSEKEHGKETDDDIDSEAITNESSGTETVKESERSSEGSVSEDVGEDSDIVGFSCSDGEATEENEDIAK